MYREYLNKRNFPKIRRILGQGLREISSQTGISYEKLLAYSKTGKANFDLSILDKFIDENTQYEKHYKDIEEFIDDIDNVFKKISFTQKARIDRYLNRIKHNSSNDKKLNDSLAIYIAENMLCCIEKEYDIYSTEDTFIFNTIDDFRMGLPEYLCINEVDEKALLKKVGLQASFNFITKSKTLSNEKMYKILDCFDNVKIENLEPYVPSSLGIIEDTIYIKTVDEFWNNFQIILSKRNMIMKDVADTVNVSLSSISRFYNRKRKPSDSVLEAILRELNVVVHEFSFKQDKNKTIQHYESELKKSENDIRLTTYNRQIMYAQIQRINLISFEDAYNKGYRAGMKNFSMFSAYSYPIKELYFQRIEDFIFALAEIMKERDISLRFLSKITNINRFTINKFMRKDFDGYLNDIQFYKALKVADILNCQIEEDSMSKRTFDYNKYENLKAYLP